VRPESIFVVLYAAALLAGAVGLHRLGRTSRRYPPARARAERPPTRTGTAATDDQHPGWPHSEVPRFYTGMALVAAGASTLLPAGELLGRDHRSAETAVLVTVIVVAALTLAWLRTRLH